MENLKQIREEFLKEALREEELMPDNIWQKDPDTPARIADWWLSKFELVLAEERKRIVERVEKEAQGKAAILAMNGHINIPILFTKDEIINTIKEE